MAIDLIPIFSQPPPSTSDPDNFDVRADAAFSDLANSIVPGMNTSIGQMNTTAEEVSANKDITEADKVSCENSAASALDSAEKAEAAVATLPEGTIDDLLTDSIHAWSGEKIQAEIDNVKDTWTEVSADFTAIAKGCYAVDTATNALAINCTLPVSPALNDKISFLDLKQSWGTYSLILLANGNLIMGETDDVEININNFNPSIVYTSNGWIFI